MTYESAENMMLSTEQFTFKTEAGIPHTTGGRENLHRAGNCVAWKSRQVELAGKNRTLTTQERTLPARNRTLPTQKRTHFLVRARGENPAL
jgi:hypothetical protein